MNERRRRRASACALKSWKKRQIPPSRRSRNATPGAGAIHTINRKCDVGNNARSPDALQPAIPSLGQYPRMGEAMRNG